MSTITKLSPKHREQRTMRAMLVRDMRGAAVREVDFKRRRQLEDIAEYLERVQRAPHIHGARKNNIFVAVAHKLAGSANG